MKIFDKKLILIFFLFLLFSCSINTGFYIYDINGKELNLSNIRNVSYRDNPVTLFFNREEITENFIEVNIISSNHHYYGNFYFDEVFMNSLNKRVSLLDVDALIFEKDLSKYSFYNKDYVYFTAIRFSE